MLKKDIAPMSEKTAAAMKAFLLERSLSPGEAQSLIDLMSKAERSDLLAMIAFLYGVNIGRADERARRDEISKEIARQVNVILSQNSDQKENQEGEAAL